MTLVDQLFGLTPLRTDAATPELEKALAAFDFPAMETADESACRVQVEHMTRELVKE